MEVWNANLPFDSGGGSKDRPVVVLSRSGGGCDVLMVTTHPHEGMDVMRPMEAYEAGLDGRSYIRTDRRFRIPLSNFNYYMGELGEDDEAIVRAKQAR